jgi:hypothetical protein
MYGVCTNICELFLVSVPLEVQVGACRLSLDTMLHLESRMSSLSVSTMEYVANTPCIGLPL